MQNCAVNMSEFRQCSAVELSPLLAICAHVVQSLGSLHLSLPSLSAFFTFFGHFAEAAVAHITLFPSLGGGRRSLPEKSAFSTNNRSWAIIRKARFKSPVEFAPLPLVQYVNYLHGPAHLRG